MFSGRSPTTTSFPSWCDRGRTGWSAASSTLSRKPPNSTNIAPSELASVPSTMFMAGDPMNPATNRFDGGHVQHLWRLHLLAPLRSHGHAVAHRHRFDLVRVT